MLQRCGIIVLGVFLGIHSTWAQTLPAVPAAIPAQPTVTQPQGDYQSAWLTLTEGDKASQVFLALRGGKPVQFWALAPQLPGCPKPQGSPKLLTDALRGQTQGQEIKAEVDLRLVSIWAPQSRLATMTLTLTMKIGADQKLTGTWRNQVGEKSATGTVTGTLSTAETTKKEYCLAPGQDWPGFYGVMAAARGPDYGKPLLDDLAQAKPLWRSESVTLSGWGTGVDSRYKTRAAYGTLCGGSSSPIVADGRVYLYHYRPADEPGVADADLLAKFQDNAFEQTAIRRFFAQRADVVVTCLDATTGQTLWESVWANKQGNYQTHKWRGLNHTPSVAKGVLVVSDYSWGLHAYDAKTGQLLWTRGGNGPIPSNQGAIGPVISGDVVVWTAQKSTVGLDLRTGKELWQAPGATGARRMLIADKERVLLVGPTLLLLDPATGAPVARGDYPGGYDKKGKRELGEGLGANLVCSGPYIVTFETVEPKDKKVPGNIVALKVVDDKITLAWRNEIGGSMEDGHVGLTIANNYVFTAFQDVGAFCLD
ncbi:MAG: PQQ-binding-like beta-propeller repeat protein, partial [Phycisphaerae bacterium]